MVSIWLVTGAVVAYLIGSIPTSVWIGRIFYKKDIRDFGSGNAGATNTFRVLGATSGIFVLLFDAFKGWLTVYMGNFLYYADLTATELNSLKVIMAFFAVLGHIYPIYVKFKGGKGVATLIGVLLAISPEILLILIGVFLTSLIITRYVSFSSLLSALLYPVCVFFIIPMNSCPHYAFSFVVAILVVFTHRENIKRLVNGTESKVKLKKNN